MLRLLRKPAEPPKPTTTRFQCGASMLFLACFTCGSLLAAEPPQPNGRTAVQRLSSNVSTPSAPSPEPAGAATSASPKAAVYPGDYLVRRSAMSLMVRGELSAELRYRAELDGIAMRGHGRYLQTGTGDQMQCRYELRLALGERVTSLTQILDANETLWTDRALSGVHEITRLDLRLLRNELLPQEDLTEVAATLPSAELAGASGGLAQVILGLEANFGWGLPEAREQNGFPLLRLRGTWRPNVLTQQADQSQGEYARRAQQAGDQLPPHVPDAVELDLGKEDGFPYRIAFLKDARRKDAKELPKDGPQAREAETTLMLLEFHRVQFNPQLDRQQFVFELGEREYLDRTRRVLEQIRNTSGGQRQATVAPLIPLFR